MTHSYNDKSWTYGFDRLWFLEIGKSEEKIRTKKLKIKTFFLHKLIIKYVDHKTLAIFQFSTSSGKKLSNFYILSCDLRKVALLEQNSPAIVNVNF